MFPRCCKFPLLASGVIWTSLSLLSIPTAAPAQPAATTAITIPAQDLETALMKLAQVTGRNILFVPDVVRGRRSSPVTNATSFETALHEMLGGTHMVAAPSGDSMLVQPEAAPNKAREPDTTKISQVDRTEVDEVTVTARKTRERLGDVPIAVTALSGNQLTLSDHRRIEDVNALVPSTNFVITNGHQASFSIRGLGTNPGNDGLEGSAGVFLDGIYLGRPGMAAMDLIDVNQIEVLRGPQGTLFGKNTTAGAANITTAPPSQQFSTRLQATYGNYGFQQYQGTVTGPLLPDVLAGRLTAFDTRRNGTVYDVSTRTHVNDLNRQGVRGQLLLTPDADLSVRLIAEYEREQQSTGAVVNIASPGATPAALQTKFNAVGAAIAFDPTGKTTADGVHDQTGTRQAGLSAEVNWNIGDFTLTSLSAYRYWRYISNADNDGTAADVLSGGYRISDNQWSQELRLKLPRLGDVDTIAGFYYFQQGMHVDAQTIYGSEGAAWLTGVPDSQLPALALQSPSVAALLTYNNTHWDVFSTPTTHSYALFGQSVWHITSDWNATLGFRETYETKSETVYRPNPYSTLSGQPAPALSAQARAPFSLAIYDAAPSFLASTDYHLMRDLMGYLSVAQGEKAGGVNTSLPAAGLSPDSLKVSPETATNYEVGLKGEALERRLRFGMDVFYTNVRDYQATYLSTVNNSVVSLLTNVGKVHSRGVELEGTAQLLKGWTVNANASFNDAKYASYPSGPCPQGTTGTTSCDLTGRPVAGSPRWIGNLNTQYEQPITDNLIGYGIAEYSARSHYFGYLDDSPHSRIGGYALLNLRLGLHTADDRWDVNVWGKNVADKHYVANYLSYGSIIPGTYAAFFGDFATYGLTLRVSL